MKTENVDVDVLDEEATMCGEDVEDLTLVLAIFTETDKYGQQACKYSVSFTKSGDKLRCTSIENMNEKFRRTDLIAYKKASEYVDVNYCGAAHEWEEVLE